MLAFGPFMTELVARREISLPPAPTTAIRMRRLVEGAKYSRADLVDVIAADQIQLGLGGDVRRAWDRLYTSVAAATPAR